MKATKPTAEKPPKPTPMPGVSRCIQLFHQKHIDRHGFPPIISGGKDGSLIRRLLQTWPETEVTDLINEFFVTTDPRVVRSDYSIGAFYSLAQHLRIRRNQPNTDPRTLQNIDALARATGRRG